MEIEGFRYEVKAILKFTVQELKRLQGLALSHYDSECRLTAERGGVIYLMLVRAAIDAAIKDSPDPLAVSIEGSFSFREVDLLAKISKNIEFRKLLLKMAGETERLSNNCGFQTV